MGKIKNIVFAVIAIVAVISIYKLFFIRTVYYEVAGVKIPSKYNVLTGSVKPITDYKGKPIQRTVVDRTIKNIGLSDEQVTLAQFRWAVFQQWAAMHPQYKGWDKYPDIFKKANADFQKEMETSPVKVKVLK